MPASVLLQLLISAKKLLQPGGVHVEQQEASGAVHATDITVVTANMHLPDCMLDQSTQAPLSTLTARHTAATARPSDVIRLLLALTTFLSFSTISAFAAAATAAAVVGVCLIPSAAESEASGLCPQQHCTWPSHDGSCAGLCKGTRTADLSSSSSSKAGKGVDLYVV